MPRSFIITVLKSGLVTLSTPDSLASVEPVSQLLAHNQLGIDTKPWELDDFMEKVRETVWHAWREQLDA